MIIYKENKEISLTNLKNLYSSVGWSAYTDNIEILMKAIDNSLCVISAWNENELVGLIRIIGDSLTIIYIQDILINPKYENKEIGTSLMQQILKKYENVRQKVLITDEDINIRKFYEKNGLKSADKGEIIAFYKFD